MRSELCDEALRLGRMLAELASAEPEVYGLAALDRASGLGGGRGNYTLQASIAVCHARAPSADETGWEKIAWLYAELGRIAPSPVVELNRAVAVSMAFGAQAGLDILDLVADDPVRFNDPEERAKAATAPAGARSER